MLKYFPLIQVLVRSDRSGIFFRKKMSQPSTPPDDTRPSAFPVELGRSRPTGFSAKKPVGKMAYLPQIRHFTGPNTPLPWFLFRNRFFVHCPLYKWYFTWFLSADRPTGFSEPDVRPISLGNSCGPRKCPNKTHTTITEHWNTA